ncbi:Na+/H+ antiporter subunit E [Blastococcus sp. PRF04-17]|uniref:Na+/H+ antiporter subunit E n=1 Tax=Blastococcus sp. PRF04-17 TaxID=2933797 RepID=UPI001FF461D7|nr:Na+/H+ antiporter subunit E [Blastococcus sp. PRF04-17]UOX99959.1 Na+/H+ antiporter subunit E [Blastococcus sp. PRF04-17]
MTRAVPPDADRGPDRAGRSRATRIAVFCGSYLLRFLRANLDVARVIVARRPRLAPAVVEIELRSRTPAEIATLMGLITLTPGTMALDLAADRSRLTVHGMQAPDLAAFRADLGVLEEQMLGAMRSTRRLGERRAGSGRR